MSELPPKRAEELIEEASKTMSGKPLDFDPREQVALNEDAQRYEKVEGEQRARDVRGANTTPMPDDWFNEVED